MPPATYSFTLDSFTIFQTRSRHEDTDYASLTIRVHPSAGTDTVTTAKKSIGNVNNGLHSVVLTIPNVAVNPGDVVYMSYLIVNAGHSSPGAIETALENAGVKLATAAGATVAGAIIGSSVPIVGTAIGAVLGFIAGEIENILTANCDGTVAAEVQVFSYDQLASDLSTLGYFNWETNHPGTKSAAGCGENSSYLTGWHIDAGGYKPFNGKASGSVHTGGGPISPDPSQGTKKQN